MNRHAEIKVVLYLVDTLPCGYERGVPSCWFFKDTMAHERKNTVIFEGFAEHEPFDPAHPERNLLRAILRTALNDIHKAGDAQKQAKEFFLSSDEDYIFSFRSICFFLGLDPKQVLTITGVQDHTIDPVVNTTQPSKPAPESYGEDSTH